MAIKIEIVEPDGCQPIATRRDLYRAAAWPAMADRIERGERRR